jgi:hypothetical protein
MSGPDVHDPRLAGVYAKLKRGSEHGHCLHGEIGTFIHRDNCKINTEFKANGIIHLSLSFPEPVPIRFGPMLGDAIHNIRTAIDHLAGAAAALSGVGPAGISFPISRSAAALKDAIGKDLKGVPDKFVEIVEQIEPYKGGKGHILYELNQLDRMDKHRLLLPTIAVSTRSRAFFYVGEPGQPNYRQVGPPAFEIEQDVFPALEPGNTVIEAIITRGPATPPEANLYFGPTFQIRFDKGVEPAGKEIFGALGEMGRQVQDIVAIVDNALFKGD